VEIIDATSVSAFFVRLYDYAWFVGFAIAFAIYLALRGLSSEIKRDASTHSTFAQGRLSRSVANFNSRLRGPGWWWSGMVDAIAGRAGTCFSDCFL